MFTIVESGKNCGKAVFYNDEDAAKVERGTLYLTNSLHVLIFVDGRIIPLSHYLLGYTGNLVIDHIDRNPLNNHRSNFREATTQQNLRNRGKFSSYAGRVTTSQYKGVTYDWKFGSWKAQIGVDSSVIYLGHYDSEIEAAMAYNQAALEYFGEFASLNVLPNVLDGGLFVPMTFENLVRLLCAVQDDRCIIAARKFVDSIESLDSIQLPDPSDVREQLIASVALRAISRAMHKKSPNWSNEIRIADSNDQAQRIDELLKGM